LTNNLSRTISLVVLLLFVYILDKTLTTILIPLFVLLFVNVLSILKMVFIETGNYELLTEGLENQEIEVVEKEEEKPEEEEKEEKPEEEEKEEEKPEEKEETKPRVEKTSLDNSSINNEDNVEEVKEGIIESLLKKDKTDPTPKNNSVEPFSLLGNYYDM
ncbi:hypothetical protein CL656_07130, partial [bacterium]|nr:hypothetical protein [bacterium]